MKNYTVKIALDFGGAPEPRDPVIVDAPDAAEAAMRATRAVVHDLHRTDAFRYMSTLRSVRAECDGERFVLHV